MKNYLTQNSKMKRASGVPIFNFGIPAFRSETGFITCPMAGICAKGCYARSGAFTWPVVQFAYEERLRLTQSSFFVDAMIQEIQRRGIGRVRIHDSGDFYNDDYLAKWVEVMNHCPETHFYAYTKMVAMFKGWMAADRIPVNFTVIFSEGGRQDRMISQDDRHAKVFEDRRELLMDGYSDASHDDAVAFGRNKRIGLIYHGGRDKRWTTANVK